METFVYVELKIEWTKKILSQKLTCVFTKNYTTIIRTYWATNYKVGGSKFWVTCRCDRCWHPLLSAANLNFSSYNKSHCFQDKKKSKIIASGSQGVNLLLSYVQVKSKRVNIKMNIVDFSYIPCWLFQKRGCIVATCKVLFTETLVLTALSNYLLTLKRSFKQREEKNQQELKKTSIYNRKIW